MQLHRQQLVEYFSAVVVSYYGFGFASYFLNGFEYVMPELPVPVVDAVLVTGIVIGMRAIVHRLKRRVLGGHARGRVEFV